MFEDEDPRRWKARRPELNGGVHRPNPAVALEELKLRFPQTWAREMRNIVALELAMGTALDVIADTHGYGTVVGLAEALRQAGQPEPAEWLEAVWRAQLANGA